MCSNRATLSETDLLMFHWSCRKSDLRGPVGGGESAVSKATVGLVIQSRKCFNPLQAPFGVPGSGCFKEGRFKEQGHKPLKWSGTVDIFAATSLRSEMSPLEMTWCGSGSCCGHPLVPFGKV